MNLKLGPQITKVWFDFQRLDYSIILKAKQDELFHTLIAVHNHEVM